MDLTSILEAGRRDFLDATSNISPNRASARPVPGRWTVLECIEHVVTAEGRFLGWISNSTLAAPPPDPDRGLRIFTIVRSRLTKRDAPEVVWPAGRFKSLEVALAEFNAVRDRSIQTVEERGPSIYSIGAKHPFFGDLNGAELIQLIDGHARRHADQIREICE